MHHRVVIGISGASGAAYSVRLLKLLAEAGVECHVAVTALGRRMLFEELEIKKADPEALVGADLAGRVVIHGDNDFGALIASG
ncbi:MAG: aromatic acid decarboxylase, partial [Phycisphaerales bacterium]|nr:aromatic acid decarboxylase [Phycisphaerales bacterium]